MILGLGIAIVAGVEEEALLVAIILGALAFGVLFVLPIGGADMPVVISMLNAFTGVAASATGFVFHETVLIVSGMLVGAAGTLLTLMMARRSDARRDVLFGAFGQLQVTEEALAASSGAVKSTTAEDVGVLRRTRGASSSCRATAWPSPRRSTPCANWRTSSKEGRRRPLRHPSRRRTHAGPYERPARGGEVPYDQLHEMDRSTAFEQTDVALVIGANDVTNPAARSDPGSPIYGMPILDVDHAKHVVVLSAP